MKSKNILLLALLITTIALSAVYVSGIFANESSSCCAKGDPCEMSYPNVSQEIAKESPKPDSKPQEVILRKAKGTEVGKKAECPVRKEKFTVAKETEAAEYKGKAYFFCCPGCAPKFKANPGNYVK